MELIKWLVVLSQGLLLSKSTNQKNPPFWEVRRNPVR